MNKKVFVMSAILVVLAMALTACGGGGGAQAPEPLNVTLKGQDIKYDVTTITAKAGQVINVTYINEGALDHTFVLDGIVSEQKAAPGQTINFSFTAPGAGTYKFYCDVAGHQEAGMVGTLTVNP